MNVRVFFEPDQELEFFFNLIQNENFIEPDQQLEVSLKLIKRLNVL